MNKKAFTLIELLVVIAIIAILAAILFPVFARARAKAQQTLCLSNVKQIVLALNMYTTDNDGKYMNLGWMGNCWASYDAVHLLRPYTSGGAMNTGAKSDQIWLCPSLKPAEAVACDPANEPWWNAVTLGNHDYMWNNLYYNNSYGWGGLSASRIPDSAGVIAMGDGWGGGYGDTVAGYAITGWTGALTADPPWWPNGVWDPGNPQRWVGRHNGMVNWGFLDGHAKAMTLNQVQVPQCIGGRYCYFSVQRPGS